MKQQRISNIDRLEREIYRKKLRLKEIEFTLDRNLDHLKGNFRDMAIHSVFGSRRSQGGRAVAADVAMRLLESEKLQDSLITLVEKLADKIGSGISRARHRITNK